MVQCTIFYKKYRNKCIAVHYFAAAEQSRGRDSSGLDKVKAYAVGPCSINLLRKTKTNRSAKDTSGNRIIREQQVSITVLLSFAMSRLILPPRCNSICKIAFPIKCKKIAGKTASVAKGKSRYSKGVKYPARV